MKPPIIRRKGDGIAVCVRLDGGAVWAHPDVLNEALAVLRPPDGDHRLTAWFHLRSAVELVEHIARHPAGTEAVVKQIRQYRRRIKVADSPATPNPEGYL